MTFAIRMTEVTDPLPAVPATAITWDRTGAGIWIAEDGSTRRVSGHHPLPRGRSGLDRN